VSQAIEPGLLHLIRHTPMRDVVRGRLSGRLDVERRIMSADLPEQARALVWRIVRRTKLWPLEKVEVADELLAHFADGLKSGATIEQLIQTFGDDERTVRLIRRAKKRNRPILWHILRAIGWAIIALVLIYLGMALFFFLGRPTVKVNYIDRLNAPLASIPQDQRAWPIYREAIIALEYRQPGKISDEQLRGLLSATPRSKDWQKLVEFLTSHADGVELIRQGAHLPTLGVVYGSGGSSDDPSVWPEATPQASGTFLFSVLLRHVSEMGLLTDVLAADAELARSRGDSDVLVRDLEALLGIVQQTNKEKFLSTANWSLRNRLVALKQISRTLSDAPQLLRDQDLQRLAHGLASVHSAAELIQMDHERMLFQDLVQRMYTDDGDGDGRLTPTGIKLLRDVTSSSPKSTLNVRGLDLLVGPANFVVCAGRRELTDEYTQLMDLAESNLRRPLREADWSEFDRRVLQMRTSGGHYRYLPLSIMMPSFQGLHTFAERFLGQRDGVLVAIALEVYKREHGEYPVSLDLLTPNLLATIPLDRITGMQVQYRLVDGTPVVYSFGMDRDDDGGRLPQDRGTPDRWRAAQWGKPTGRILDGDWVLYPEPMIDSSEIHFNE
jgi:hypothetical protein